MVNKPLFAYLLFTITCLAQASLKPTVAIAQTSHSTSTVSVTFPVSAGDHLYKEYLDISIDNPDIVLSAWQSDKDALSEYDPSFKDTKKMFKETVTLTMEAKKSRPGVEQANIHISYYHSANKEITEEVVPLSFVSQSMGQPAKQDELGYAVEVQDVEVESPVMHPQKKSTPTPKQQIMESLSAQISVLAETTESTWLRILLVFLLGILLSLTPCIYPMIPITVGILQSRGSTSLVSNFLISLCYVAGIATTFAILGLLAAFTGQMFGTIMSNPIVILIIVALLIYLALSMFGFYEMYIPKSLQNNKQTVKRGSYLSVFLFGAVSGSVASPCLSPGLLLLLSIVTTLGSTFMGFVLLFSFGLGLGLPLLIIGTFSSSLNVLPRAGMWMVEIKKLFGLMMLGMCFYFLNFILPPTTIAWMLAAFTLMAGIASLYDAKKTTSSGWRTSKNILGIGLIALSVVLGAQAYKTMMFGPDHTENIWLQEYDKALVVAQKEGKKLFVDVGAPFCSICKAIDKTVLSKPAVVGCLKKCVPVKIDGSDTTNPSCCTVKDCYNVVGFPTFLLIDASSGKVIKQWGSELYEKPHEEFIAELEGLIA